MSTAPRGRGIGGDQRYRGGVVCPICGGSEDDDRGLGIRCYGFIGGDRLYAHCSREEQAGGLPFHANSQTFAHKLNGSCKCGVEHGPALPRSAPTTRKASRSGRIVATYDYVDEDGKLLYQVVRKDDPKGFSQRRPGQFRGTFVYSLGDVRRVLYRLPDLLQSDPAGPVFVVEGEKDADALRGLGLVATCNAGGAGKWRAEYGPSLKDRLVCVLPDNDKPGADHADQVAKLLAGIAREVKLLDLVGLCQREGLGQLPEKGDASDFLQMGGTAEHLRSAIASTIALRPFRVVGADDPPSDPPAPPADTPGESRAGRPSIEINTERHRALKASVDALRADPDLYCRGEGLVTVVADTDDELKISKRSRMTGLLGSPKVITISDPIVGCRLTENAEFFAWKKDKKGEDFAVDVHPPDWLIKSVSTLRHWPGIRPLMAVAECPFPREDGTIVETRGYDADTATLYLPSIVFPKVPARPNRTDAKAAWERIRPYVDDFPFASEDDRVVFLAGLLTIIARPSIEGPVPGIAVIGNKAGIGKGLLVDAMVIPGTGRPCPTSTYPDSGEEAAKVKVAIAKAAKVAIHFDNLVKGSSYGGGPLDSALTTTVIDDRQLGGNEAPPLPLRSAWFLSGNNVTPCQDAYRRWLVCNLETNLDHPERRTDIRVPDLRKHILDGRGEIVRDALTILRSHALSRYFKPEWDGFGSFEDWDRVVRGAVWYATERDCLATQRTADEGSDDRRWQMALLEGWSKMPGGKKGSSGLTADEVLAEIAANPKLYPELRLALMERGRGGELPTVRQVGTVLRGMKNTPTGPYILREQGKRHQCAVWAIEIIAAK